MLSDNCYAVIMAGGAGTRLWPLSSRDRPKHFLKLFAGRSLIELTVDKLHGQLPEDRIIVLTSVKYREVAQSTLPQIPPENFIYEPCLRDTASAIGLRRNGTEVKMPGGNLDRVDGGSGSSSPPQHSVPPWAGRSGFPGLAPRSVDRVRSPRRLAQHARRLAETG